MRRPFAFGTRAGLAGLAAATAALAGCDIPEPGGDGGDGTATGQPTRTVTRTEPAPQLPPEPQPAGVVDACPYLPTADAERANGQGVSEVRTSAEKPHPTCFFYRPDGEVQLTTQVFTGEPDVATGIVNRAAPIDTSNPTEQPAGWSGGYLSGDDGAVYAVSKQGTAVVVTTNQSQSVKARTVATDVIATLGL
ncbi:MULTISPECIES: DUF2020 domain-containing protein [Prauserella salsuginis group]|uniref:DUF2020 domain-containing protein n=2 Tax=Prauserella salsuginis group TaxID=2893672 RepID=A0A839XIT9_9PSEU|nr:MULTISPECIES: DUF2020 domain-containing protein [Prauserella salsuginis group]MBB3662671.1 hypothetical protein [Prauserella sediminis]MCR3720369.1 protein of unknown function (DUF2020) [Prauserella flava]MCR3733922.1 protein of unknown function (DUF2020) [Prauserella salsuginis]